jgi:hypothetical protein
VKEVKCLSINGREGGVNIVNGSHMDLAVIYWTLQLQHPLYKGVGSIEVDVNVPGRYFTT